jgi:uncharacterized protein YkwD
MKAKRWTGMAGLLVLALTACGGTTPSTTNKVDVTAVSLKPTAEEQLILNEVNVARSQARDCDSTHHYQATAPLAWNSQLAAAALAHSRDMADHGWLGTQQHPELAHNGSDGSTMVTRIQKAGYNYAYIGENVAAGQLPSEVVAAWLASPGHCENIMDPEFKETGISYVYNEAAAFQHSYTQNFGAQQ